MLRTLLCSGLGSLLYYPPTSPSSLSFILYLSPTHKHTYTHTHIFPRAVDTKVLMGLMGSNRL